MGNGTIGERRKILSLLNLKLLTSNFCMQQNNNFIGFRREKMWDAALSMIKGIIFIFIELETAHKTACACNRAVTSLGSENNGGH